MLKITKLIAKMRRDNLLYDFDNTVPFVFKGADEPPKPVKSQATLLDLPFENISIEMEPDDCSICVEFYQKAAIDVIHVHEIAPEAYEFLLWLDDIKTLMLIRQDTIVVFEPEKTFKKTNEVNQIYNFIIALVDMYLQKLYEGATAKGQPPLAKAKYKNKKGIRCNYTPSFYVYISSSKKQKSSTTSRSRHGIVRWEDGWRVRNHWRRLQNPDALGIGRNGKREIKGYTWIKNYFKGDENSVRRKIYRVNNPQQGAK